MQKKSWSLKQKLLTSGLALTGIVLPIVVFAASSDEILPNPLAGINSIQDLLYLVSRNLISLIAIVATFMFIYGGVLMLTSAGNEEQVKKAKKVLQWTLVSLVIIVFSAAVVQFTLNAIGTDKNQTGTVNPGSFGLGSSDLIHSIINTIKFVLGLLGLASVAMLIYGGYLWISSAGNEQQVEKAQGIIRATIIGIIIILLSWAIVQYVVLGAINVTSTK